MSERNAEQEEVDRSRAADADRTSGPKARVEAYVTKNRPMVEEYADGDYSTAWLNEALLSLAECDGRANGVTEQ